MEIAKFIFACIGSFITAAGFFGGLWARDQKKQEDKIASAQASAREQIKAIEARAREEIKEVREGATIKTDKLEKRIDALEKTVGGLQKEVNASLGQRLSSIEGQIKGMSNILNQIQDWFIKNTSRS